MRLFFFAASVLCHVLCNSQNIVVDANTKRPIPFSRYEYGDKRGYADLNGLINISLKDSDTMKLSALGYNELTIFKAELLPMQKLYMTVKVEELDAITLKIDRPQRVLTAGTASKRNGFRRFPIGYESRYLVKLTPLEVSKPLRIDNIRFFFSDLKQESRYATNEGKQFTLKFSVLNQNFESLHEQLYFSKSSGYQNIIDFDFTDARVFIEKDIFYIAIEGLVYLNEDGSYNDFRLSIMSILTEKEFNEFSLQSYLASATNANQELEPLTNLFHNAYKDGDIKAPTGLPPTEVYNLNPMMEFTITPYE